MFQANLNGLEATSLNFYCTQPVDTVATAIAAVLFIRVRHLVVSSLESGLQILTYHH